MAFKSILCLALILGSSVSYSASSQDTEQFDQYVEGALKVYSQFKEPSKQESEQFYSFIKTKWQTENCTENCLTHGTHAGFEYANRMKIPVDSDSIE